MGAYCINTIKNECVRARAPPIAHGFAGTPKKRAKKETWTGPSQMRRVTNTNEKYCRPRAVPQHMITHHLVVITLTVHIVDVWTNCINFCWQADGSVMTLERFVPYAALEHLQMFCAGFRRPPPCVRLCSRLNWIVSGFPSNRPEYKKTRGQVAEAVSICTQLWRIDFS